MFRVSSILFLRQKVCIVGSGPSGLYSAKYLLKDDASIYVDVIDSLPSPFGEFFFVWCYSIQDLSLTNPLFIVFVHIPRIGS